MSLVSTSGIVTVAGIQQHSTSQQHYVKISHSKAECENGFYLLGASCIAPVVWFGMCVKTRNNKG